MSNLIKASKKLSYLLRHAPQEEFPLSQSGWANCSDACRELKITREQLQEIVDTDNKGRYQIAIVASADVIRAVQGHSTQQVAIDYPAATPPDVLFHGTPARNVASILEQGLNSQTRHHVHFSQDTVTAEQVGLRGTTKAAILSVDAQQMVKDGIVFHQAENGVWLVESVVAPKYLKVLVYRDK